MTIAPCLSPRCVAAQRLLLCLSVCLLLACSDPREKLHAGEPAPSNNMVQTAPDLRAQRPSATLSYEDRQMMRRYIVQSLVDGIAAIMHMQARIDGEMPS